tara:strand:- start:1201 stop:1356 length:156 start_codon:yes stop_codon:yes gene_type:complete
MSKFWIHICKEVGETATLHGERCNWCDVTQEDVEEKVLKSPVVLEGKDYDN